MSAASRRKPPENILITGASSGIGAALALYYAAPGKRLALGGRDAARLGAIAATCRDKGADVQEMLLDVTDRAALALALDALDRLMPLDLVIANAGISGGTGQSDAEAAAQVRAIFDTNVYGVLNVIEPLLPRMAARGCGQVALMSSLASFSGWPGAPAYSASKAAVRIYGEALRGGMAAQGVRVSVICPGFIRTPMTAANGYAMPFMMDADRAARIIAAGLARDAGRIAFPWQTYMLAGFFGMLPHSLSLRLFTRLPRKPPSS